MTLSSEGGSTHPRQRPVARRDHGGMASAASISQTLRSRRHQQHPAMPASEKTTLFARSTTTSEVSIVLEEMPGEARERRGEAQAFDDEASEVPATRRDYGPRQRKPTAC